MFTLLLGCEYHEGKRPWGVPCDLAFPCAKQNEMSGDKAEELIENGVIPVAEGANMLTDLEGVGWHPGENQHLESGVGVIRWRIQGGTLYPHKECPSCINCDLGGCCSMMGISVFVG